MGLEIQTKKSIKFGDESFVPKINAEQMLRLQRAKFDTAESMEDMRKLVASCFEEREKVAEYLVSVDVFQLSLIQAYLVGGDAMVETIQSRLASIKEKPDGEDR